MDELLGSLAREVAIALRDDDARQDLLAALHASPFRESKLHFRTFLMGDGRRLLAVLNKSLGGDSHVFTTLDSLVDLEFYLPAPQHRATWVGGPDFLVGTVIDDDGSTPHVFDSSGSPVLLGWVSIHDPPATPVLSLVPVETDFSRPPAQSAAVRVSSAASDPGVYMVRAAIPDDYESFFGGAPEFEVHVFVRNPAGTFIDLQCAGEEQSIPFWYNHDNTDAPWLGEVTLILENGIGTNPVQLSIWENDNSQDFPCRPAAGRLPEVDNGVVDNYSVWGARPVTSVTSSGGTKVVVIDTLPVAIALNDNYAGNDDDEVGELQFGGGSCWPEQGPVRFNLYLSGPGHASTGSADLDFRFGQRDPVCPPPPDPLPGGSVQISGPSTVRPDDLCTYFGSATQGVPPYEMSWYQNSRFLGTGSEIAVETGSSNFGLHLQVFDANGRPGSATMSVSVVSSARACFQ